jgi:hypothetical protein
MRSAAARTWEACTRTRTHVRCKGSDVTVGAMRCVRSADATGINGVDRRREDDDGDEEWCQLMVVPACAHVVVVTAVMWSIATWFSGVISSRSHFPASCKCSTCEWCFKSAGR